MFIFTKLVLRFSNWNSDSLYILWQHHSKIPNWNKVIHWIKRRVRVIIINYLFLTFGKAKVDYLCVQVKNCMGINPELVCPTVTIVALLGLSPIWPLYKAVTVEILVLITSCNKGSPHGSWRWKARAVTQRSCQLREKCCVMSLLIMVAITLKGR